MIQEDQILLRIKTTVSQHAPDAQVILYGSHARGDFKENSDYDILILLDRSKLTIEEEKKIKYPLYEIEFECGKIISPLILTKHDWIIKHHITPFYENISREGIEL